MESIVKLEEILAHVEPDRRPAFLTFVATGEADEGFLQFLERDERAQQAVEIAFRAQAEALQRVGRALADAAVELGCEPGRESAGESLSPCREAVSRIL